MTEDLNLKLCPFCGNHAVRVKSRNQNEWSFVCSTYYDDEPDCVIIPMTHVYDTIHEAVAAWNKRLQDYPQGKLVGYLIGAEKTYCALENYNPDDHQGTDVTPLYSESLPNLPRYSAMPVAYRWLAKPDYSKDIWSYAEAGDKVGFSPEFRKDHHFQDLYSEELRTQCRNTIQRLQTVTTAYEEQVMQNNVVTTELEESKKKITVLEAEVKSYKMAGVLPIQKIEEDEVIVARGIEPKNCPWCDYKGVIKGNIVSFKVICGAASHDEKCFIAPETGDYHSKEAAVAAWNRTIDQKVLDNYTRGEIGEILRPFAHFASWTVDEEGWSDTEQRQPIKVWFGPSDFREVQKLAVAIQSYNPDFTYRDSDLLVEIGMMKKDNEKLQRAADHTREWYAVRLHKIEQIAKRENLWDEIAYVIGNGQSSRILPDGTNFIDPDNFAFMLNSAKWKTEFANERVDKYKMAFKILRNSIGKEPFVPASIVNQIINNVEHDDKASG